MGVYKDIDGVEFEFDPKAGDMLNTGMRAYELPEDGSGIRPLPNGPTTTFTAYVVSRPDGTTVSFAITEDVYHQIAAEFARPV